MTQHTITVEKNINRDRYSFTFILLVLIMVGVGIAVLYSGSLHYAERLLSVNSAISLQEVSASFFFHFSVLTVYANCCPIY